jgi:hypothetical protein
MLTRNLAPTIPGNISISGSTLIPVRVLFCIFFIFSFPAFTLQLAMNPVTGQWVGSPVFQVATLSSELFVFAIILSSNSMLNFVLRCWQLWVLILISFVSSTWSIFPKITIHASNTYMVAALLGLVIAGVLPQFQCIRFAIRVMVLGCVLSIVWVFVFPKAGVHQLTDHYQTVHAGLWRGVFSHKQGLGVFAGMTTGLLVFYGRSIFPLPLLVISLACSLICLIGTESATGVVVAVITPIFFYASYFATRLPPESRRRVFLIFTWCAIAIVIGFQLGVFNFLIVHILGKSTDLSGRTEFWQYALINLHRYHFDLLGGGFGANLAAYLAPGSIDNGYFDKFIEFGYLSSPIVFVTFAAILVGGIRLVLTTSSTNALTNIFPFAIWSVILILNVTESNLMTKCFETVLTSIAIGLIHQRHPHSVSGSAKTGYATKRLHRW